MASIFWLQFRALIWKNWIVLSKYPFITILRCFILPIAYGVFLTYAQLFLSRINNYGLGTPVPIKSLQTQFDGKTLLIWADGTNTTSTPTPQEIMAHITSDFSSEQLVAVRQVGHPSEIPAMCPQNFNLFSQCFAAISFVSLPEYGSFLDPVNYTIFADGGLSFIDVDRHTSDFEKRILPLQWRIDKAIIELKTGVEPRTPMEWPYTKRANADQFSAIRKSYMRGVRDLIGLAFFVTFVGISYQIPGSVAGERALLITEHMKVMGLLDSARILSWHVGISLTYLPAWIVVSLTWKFRVFTETHVAITVILHVLLGLVLASWSFFVAAPFGKSPQLAAVVTTFIAIGLAIVALAVDGNHTALLACFSVLFPPMFYIFALKAITGYENHGLATALTDRDPDRGIMLLPLLITALVDIFLWPYLAILLEKYLYDASVPRSSSSWSFWRQNSQRQVPLVPKDTCISIRNLTKVYTPPLFSSKGDVKAVSGLSLDIPKTGIFVLLGSNGAGKSTTLSILAGLSSITSGTVAFIGGLSRPSRGTLGIVPQKNVLFPELTCLQTLRVWKAVKWSSNSEADEDLEQLLRDCDLGKKIHANSLTMSGGQKRKLQLAIGLLGGSKIVLVDECTSGVDPLSRRAVWKTLTAFREDRCIIFTTHFLDEADLLADHIAILAAPGKVVASGSPVALKRDLGEGYTVQVSFATPAELEKDDFDLSIRQILLEAIQDIAPLASMTSPSTTQSCYHLKTRDVGAVRKILSFLDDEVRRQTVTTYDILGTTIEDIFLNLMNKEDAISAEEMKYTESSETMVNVPLPLCKPSVTNLPNGRPVSAFRQAFTIFYKRLLIARRSWLTPLLTVAVAVAGACIPLVFIKGRQETCVKQYRNTTLIPLYFPTSPIVPLTLGPSSRLYENPPQIVETLGNSTWLLRTTGIDGHDAFTGFISNNYHNLSLGGVSMDLETGDSLIAWEASPPGVTGAAMLNMATNVLYNRALNDSGIAGPNPVIIRANYAAFPRVASSTLSTLRWVMFFGGAMAVYPAFYALYVSKERRSSVQAMQLSNGLTNPLGLWLGHLMFDSITVVILSSVIVLIFGFSSIGSQFHGLGYLWLIMILYGIAAALFAYCVSLMVASPLAAFAVVAGYQFIIFTLYVSAYLLILTYGPTSDSSRLITLVHFPISIVAPITSIARSGFVTVNMFSLLCEGHEVVTSASLGSILRYGGPVVYLIGYIIFLVVVLVWFHSGSRLNHRGKRASPKTESDSLSLLNLKEDVIAAAEHAETSDDLLRVLNVSKAYNGNQVVDGVGFGVPRDNIFALLGPNGAGKTTTFNMIRGDVLPDFGDIIIHGTSVVRHPRTARSSLGVCPQFTAIDSQLTVREHLLIYGRLKGLRNGRELHESIEAVLEGTSLEKYADRLASKLSGGNQRKLSLAIAIIGNPSVILIDEFSTGIDPKMKRDMWQTLHRVAKGKAVIITTHSMEEASALASSVGIMAKRMLAVGTTESLSNRYAAYEVHFSCRNREEVVKARTLMSRIPGSRMADDVATRFEVPISPDENSLSNLFNTLSGDGDFTEYTVERATLESVFLKVIRENNVVEEDHSTRTASVGV